MRVPLLRGSGSLHARTIPARSHTKPLIYLFLCRDRRRTLRMTGGSQATLPQALSRRGRADRRRGST